MRSNVTHRQTAWDLVPGEVLKEFNDQYPYLKKNMTTEQWDEHLFYQPCSRCGSKWKAKCC
ncbi:hypothetical protein [Aliivibrio fischeri]|uniref:hypothetical protein n=1 Tax=Aliivibrio fischeri TaxID=668 RepID=UPI0010601E86|nr:hypothetical protein [Aliivibrio fischeri]TDM51631.1 hypothetical protein VFFQA001_16080 [Aliivibrio fischeri]